MVIVNVSPGVDSSITFGGCQGHVPSVSPARTRPKRGMCEDPPPRVPREVGGSPALQL